MISLIVAMDKNRLIGRDNALPWHLSADLKRFKAITMAKPIVMGRKTYESIGKPLPGRRNIIVSRDTSFAAAGCEVVDSLQSAFAIEAEVEELIVIGGMQIYRQALEWADRLYLTIIQHEFEGDAWFPEFDRAEWQEVDVETHEFADETQQFTYQFVTLDRISKA